MRTSPLQDGSRVFSSLRVDESFRGKWVDARQEVLISLTSVDFSSNTQYCRAYSCSYNRAILGLVAYNLFCPALDVVS